MLQRYQIKSSAQEPCSDSLVLFLGKNRTKKTKLVSKMQVLRTNSRLPLLSDITLQKENIGKPVKVMHTNAELYPD